MQTVKPYAGWTPDPSWAAVSPHLAVLVSQVEYWNLAWLLYPQLDFLARPHDGREVNVDWLAPLTSNMDAVTIEYLRQSPDQFVDYLTSEDTGDLALTEGCNNYYQTMTKRAEEAMRRMYPTLANNVVRVDFTTRRKVG